MTNNYPDVLFEEMKLLTKFPEKSQFAGIKIHQDAMPEIISAAKSLFTKGLITQTDGGYLTDSGLETVNHLHHVLNTLS